MKTLKRLSTIAALALTSSVWGQTAAPPAPTPAAAVEAPADPTPAPPPPPVAVDDAWKLSLSVPIWLAGAQGDLTVRGVTLSGDQDTADDIDELFDSRLNGAFALHFEAEKPKYGLILEAMYLDRKIEGTVEATDAEASLRGFIGEVGGFYTIVQPAPDKRGWGRVRLDAIGGLRISALELGLDSNIVDGTAKRTFWDPFVGARVVVGLTDWLSFRARGDIAGFGIDAWHTSEFSYNVDAAFEFHLARWFDLGLGYRLLDYDIDFGSNSSMNATLTGPVVELKFNF